LAHNPSETITESLLAMTTDIVTTPRIRKSPYFEATLKAGASQFTVYNNVYLPFG
jgi:hypothetical protein